MAKSLVSVFRAESSPFSFLAATAMRKHRKVGRQFKRSLPGAPGAGALQQIDVDISARQVQCLRDSNRYFPRLMLESGAPT